MAKGTVKWFNVEKGFGFIVDSEVNGDVFVHYSAINSTGSRSLAEGDEVEYEREISDRGAKAVKVTKL